MQFALPTRSRRPRRNAHSFDIDSEPTKAAAWAWHLREHCNTGGSSSFARSLSSQREQCGEGAAGSRSSRFLHESAGANRLGGSARFTTPIWDCGSSLYDTYEIVSFGRRLERSLMEALPVLPSEGGVPETHHSMHSLNKGITQSALNVRGQQEARGGEGAPVQGLDSCVVTSKRFSFPAAKTPGRMSWTPGFAKMMKMFKKVLSSGKQAHSEKNFKETKASSKLATNRECGGVTDISVATSGKTMSSWEESEHCTSHSEDRKIKTVPNPMRKRAQDDAELMVSSHGSHPPDIVAETTFGSEGRHNHVYHHHHHHHHHHYVHPIRSRSCKV
ncbi:hypothetical protein KP509_36G008200 [Ceratopteris richardii]|uniref:Uncharacterized protein n=1 Tax=Ceratopteris richardii TaxID=49495 RepID=A0A8T2QBR5_CERRI|nr:hypothetical protein KP509_36G008200 [Ceratopteris richardii]